MRVLALNAGSSSLKAAVFDVSVDRRIAVAEAHGSDDPVAALARVLSALAAQDAAALRISRQLGHRVVHGGESLVAPVVVDAAVEAAIEACVPLAPLHNPAALAVLRAARLRWPALPQVAVFDTGFHATLPEAARRYALPARAGRATGCDASASMASTTPL